MSKHEATLFEAVCNSVGIKESEYIPGTKTELTRDKFDEVVKGILKYFKQHKNAYKAVGGGKFTNEEHDLRRLSLLYAMKFGLYFKEEQKESKIIL